jgi:choline dehydrogenase
MSNSQSPTTMLGAAMLLWISFASKAAAQDYDFVIVGGGTAGCVLAARLCEGLPDAKIALLEQGKARTEEEEFGVRAQRYWAVPTLMESWNSEPNPASGIPTGLFTGRTLGGSSSQFTSLFIEPPDLTILNDWGVNGLTDATARVYYDKVLATLAFPISKPADNILHLYAGDWLAAAQTAGIDTVDPTIKASVTDHLHYTTPIQTATGARIDASSAYIYPLMIEGGSCPNLNIIQDATVIKIDIDADTKTATGVTYVTSDDTTLASPITLTVTNEVILSAGPYHSPKLLQLSGVGPTDLLTQAGIEVHSDLPVGSNTISRPIGQVFATYLGAAMGGRPLEPAQNSTILASAEARDQFLSGEGGVWGKNVISVSGTMSGGVAEISFGPPINPDLADQPIVFLVCSPSPSTGSVKINNTNPFSLPTVELNYMSEPGQLAQMVECAEKYQATMASFPANFPMFPVYPAAGENITEYFLTSPLGLGNSFDIVAGCAVGKVVDGDFKVMGVNQLRVIDASTMPEMPEASRPLSTVYMLAELASARLIEEYATTATTPSPAGTGTTPPSPAGTTPSPAMATTPSPTPASATAAGPALGLLAAVSVLTSFFCAI